MDVIFYDKLYIRNAPIKKVRKILDQAQLINPEYVNAVKFSKWRVRNIPETIEMGHYSSKTKVLSLPLHYDITKFTDESTRYYDERNEVTCSYPESLPYRETQREVIDEFLDNRENGVIVLPTGKGKSIVGLGIAKELRQRVIVLVHTNSILDGWKQDVKLFFKNKITPGLIQGKKCILGEQVTLAMIQTLSRKSEYELSDLFENFGMVIADEMHHTPASSYKLLNYFMGKYRVGLTATPERADGMENLMYWYFGNSCYTYERTSDEKDILPVKVILKDIDLEFTPKVLWRGKEVLITSIPVKHRPKFSYFTLDEIVILSKKYRTQVLQDVLFEYKKNRKLILFFSQKNCVREYARMLEKECGVPKKDMLLFYGDNLTKTEELKIEAESVPITLATYSLVGEGTNVKAWEVAFLVSSVSNEKRAEQAIGRIRRAHKSKITPVLVYDYSLPKVYILRGHVFKRLTRYKKLGFHVESMLCDKFKRGY